MPVVAAAAVAALGLAAGSFLNVCIDRLPHGQSLLRPRSHCPACKTTLAVRDLAPVLSYMLLRGRCRYCSAAIPKRVPLVEGATALLFILLWTLHGGSPYFLLSALLVSVLIVAIGAHLERRRSPDRKPGSQHLPEKEVHDGVHH